MLLRFAVTKLDVIARILVHLRDHAAEDLFIHGQPHRQAVALFAIEFRDDQGRVCRDFFGKSGFDDEP